MTAAKGGQIDLSEGPGDFIPFDVEISVEVLSDISTNNPIISHYHVILCTKKKGETKEFVDFFVVVVKFFDHYANHLLIRQFQMLV